MSQPRGRPEDTLAAMSAGIASARALRAQAERLIALAEEQVEAAREAALERWGEAKGEALFRALADACDEAEPDDDARVLEVPGLAGLAAAPWAPAGAGASPPAMPGPSHVPAPPVAVDSAAVPPSLPVPAPASPAAVPNAAVPPPQAAVPASPPGIDLERYGVAVKDNDRKAAQRIVADARRKADSGDLSLIAVNDDKWVGIHQWRRDIYRAAFTERALERGHAPEDLASGDPNPPVPEPVGAGPEPEAPLPPAPPPDPVPVQAPVRAHALAEPARPADAASTGPVPPWDGNPTPWGSDGAAPDGGQAAGSPWLPASDPPDDLSFGEDPYGGAEAYDPEDGYVDVDDMEEGDDQALDGPVAALPEPAPAADGWGQPPPVPFPAAARPPPPPLRLAPGLAPRRLSG